MTAPKHTLSYSVDQWISCGFKMFHPDLTDVENRRWLGTFCSPQGSGGNFRITLTAQVPRPENRHWPAPEVTESLRRQMVTLAKVWDHRFLNDLEWECPVLTPESLAQGLWNSVTAAPLPQGAHWQSVQADLGESIRVQASGNGRISVGLGFRLQSIIAASGEGVDVELVLNLDGTSWKSQPVFSCVPLGELQAWGFEELPAHLHRQPVDQWLQASGIDELGEKLFPLLKQKFPALFEVSVLHKGREIITASE